VTDEAAHLRTAEQLLPPQRGDLRVADVLARQRDEHVKSASASIQRMQKVLTENECADCQRDYRHQRGDRHGDFERDFRGRARPLQTRGIGRSASPSQQKGDCQELEGNWRPELLFVLRQQMQTYMAYQKRIEECDEALAAQLRTMEDQAEPGSKPQTPKVGKRAGGNAPQFNLRGELYRISGIDLTLIDGINVMIAQTIVAEVGLDMSKWPTEAHFASWLGLCPNNKITGGKVYHRGTRHVENRAATAFRMAATSLWRSKTYLGAKFKRLRAHLGAPKAITAMAHTLARLVYRMLKYGQDYVEKGMEFYRAHNSWWPQKMCSGR